MPATAPASLTCQSPDRAVAAEITKHSALAYHVAALLACAHSLEHMGFTAEPRFTRDARGHVTGIAVHGVRVPPSRRPLMCAHDECNFTTHDSLEWDLHVMDNPSHSLLEAD